MSTSILTYLAPKEVLVNQATVLVGTFDPKIVTTVSLIAEDKYPLNITLNTSTGLWSVSLDKGFTTAGIRWLRLKGTDKTGKVVSEQIVNINVNTQALSAPFTLVTLQQTTFKLKPSDDATLKEQEKLPLQEGQVLGINSFEFTNNYLKIELINPLPTIGKIGYFSPNQVLLAQGSKLITNSSNVPQVPSGTALLRIVKTTPIKLRPDDSSQLPSSLQATLTQGENYIILGLAPVEGHFRVSLAQPITGFGSVGYIYALHVEIWKDGKQVVYDRDALLLNILKTTAFKKRPVDAVTLKPDEKVTLTVGTIYGISSYTFEEGHIKVALSENIPKFGNTGYLYPDFVQFTRGGKVFDPTPNLTYESPREFLVSKPVILQGKFDVRTMANVSLLAEDKFALKVVLNRINGTWQVNLDKGFSIAGSRWLRLKGLNSAGKMVASKIINLTVVTDASNAGETLNLKVAQDTYFKFSPIDADSLTEEQKIFVRTGQSYTVSKYGLVDGHLKVVLDPPITPLGRYGYFYEPHVQLTKGKKRLVFDISEVPETTIAPAQLLVVKPTLIKAKPQDSSSLPANQKAQLPLGKVYPVTGYACIKGHFRVTLAESIPGFGNVGYVYWQHVQIKKNNKRIPYDPKALTTTIQKPCFLKKKPLDSDLLTGNDKTQLVVGRVYGISSYTIESSHVKVALNEEFPNFGNTGYLFPSNAMFRRGDQVFNPIPNNVELNVGYLSQRDNPRFYWSTCNVTSIAMCFYYYGVESQDGGQLEDELLQWCIDYAGEGSQTDHNVLTALIRAYKFKTNFSTTSTWSQLKSELINRRPIVLAGDFTASGHIITVIGYNSQGFIVNDPWGDALTGYSDTEGSHLLYPYNYLNQVAGPDGNVWAHFISP